MTVRTLFTVPLLISRLLVLSFMAMFTLAAHAEADRPVIESVSIQFESVSWNADYQGRIAGKLVKVNLWRLGNAVMGNYCYEPCNPKRNGILLAGGAAGELTETPIDVPKGQREAKPSGRWKLGPFPGLPAQQLQGQWSSMDGKRQWEIALELAPSAFSHAPDLEVRLLMDQAVETAKDCDFDADIKQVVSIRLYRQGKLVQSLKTNATGSCYLLQPGWVDANFDGWPDLNQSLQLPAGPNIPTTTWLYDPAKKRFVLGPEELQDITSPGFDAKNQRIYNEWRGSCCSHGVDIYAWKAGKLKVVEQGESYVLPVRKAGKLMGCYIVPVYKDGHVVWPDALYRKADGLAMGRPPAADWCDLDVRSSSSQGNRLDVLAPQQPGQAAKVLAAYGSSYVEVKTPKGKRYCPDLMAFDADARKLVRLQLTENAVDSCLTEK